MQFLTTTFSPNMIEEDEVTFTLQRISLDEAKRLALECKAVIQKPLLVDLFSRELGMPLKNNRFSLRLRKGDSLLIGTYLGSRLETSSKALYPLSWTLIKLHKDKV